MYPSQAATTEDCIATYSCLTDTARILSRFIQQVQIHTRHHNLSLPHIQPHALLLHLYKLTSSSSMYSALIIKSPAYSYRGKPVRNALDRASYIMMKRSELRSDEHPLSPNSSLYPSSTLSLLLTSLYMDWTKSISNWSIPNLHIAHPPDISLQEKCFLKVNEGHVEGLFSRHMLLL